MVSDSPETIKNPLDILNASDWAQKAGLQFTRIVTAPNGQTRSWILSFASGHSIRLSTAELNSPAKVSLKLQDAFLKPVLLPKSKDMWVAYWLSYVMEAAECITKDSGIDGYIQEILGNSGYWMPFDSARKAATHFAEQKYFSTELNTDVVIGADVPRRRLLRLPALLAVYQGIHASRPKEDDTYAALQRIGYAPGSPTKCLYSRGDQQFETSIRFWWKVSNA